MPSQLKPKPTLKKYMTCLMGLVLAALAVEVMSDGLVKLFPVLGR